MHKWVILNEKIKIKNKKDLLKVLLLNRGLKTKTQIDKFLNPSLSEVTLENAKIDKTEINKSLARIKKAIDAKEKIIIFGDYDVDGICGSAILWETLNDLGANVLPYIPHRIDEGYGISKVGITNILKKYKDLGLIITVDNGIVANDAVEFAKENGIDVIITDHHVPSSNLPKAFSIVHTTLLCGAGVAYMLAKEITTNNSQLTTKDFEHLSLVAVATVADLVPATGLNRVFLKFGIEELRKTKRVGLIALMKEAGVDQKLVGTYEIGHVISPRINAMGRLEFAMDSLRLLCTQDKKSSEALARKLGTTNKKRQEITFTAFEHAKGKVQKITLESLILVADKTYQPGVIGLIAGRLTEEYYRPSIVLSMGEDFSKASARSIPGFNIIDFIRSASDLLVDAGGHPMAAGFTVETSKMDELFEKFRFLAKKAIKGELFEKKLRIDAKIDFSLLNMETHDEIQKLSPFGVGNPKAVFLSKNLQILDLRLVGFENQHVLFRLSDESRKPFEAIGFRLANRAKEFVIGDKIDIVYALEKEVWNGNTKLKLRIKDFRKN